MMTIIKRLLRELLDGGSVSHYLLLGFCLMLPFKLVAIGNDDVMSKGGATTGLGGASLALLDGWSCINNQGAVAFLEKPFLGLSYENRYGLKELSAGSVAAAYPVKYGVFSLQFNSFGSQLFALHKLGAGYSRKFGDRLGAGLHFDAFSLKMNQNEPATMLASFELGLLFMLNERSRLAFHLFNPAAISFKTTTYTERLPVEYRLGGFYQMSNKIDMVYEVAGSNEAAPFLRTGFRYHLVENFNVSLGFQTLGASLGGGLEYSLEKFRVNFACRSTQKLGRIYSLSLSYYLK